MVFPMAAMPPENMTTIIPSNPQDHEQIQASRSRPIHAFGATRISMDSRQGQCSYKQQGVQEMKRYQQSPGDRNIVSC